MRRGGNNIVLVGLILQCIVVIAYGLNFKSLMRKRQGYDVFHEECSAEREDRQQCGKKTFNELECKSRGCCFRACEGCDADVPWCFLAARMTNEMCQVDYKDKDDCGYYGISEGECMMRGCCWAPSPLANDPPCFNKKTNVLRLVDGRNESEGRVEILHDGEWGTICDDSFGSEEALVICRSFGYAYGYAEPNAHFGPGEGKTWMDDLQCTGDEEKLEDCSFPGWGREDCGHEEDAGVKCTNDVPPENADDIRLVNGPDPSSGTIEILYDGVWGTICDDGFGNETARVVCRMLGFVDGIEKEGAFYGSGNGPILLDEVYCTGGEESINDCQHAPWNAHDCSHGEDVGVICFDEEIDWGDYNFQTPGYPGNYSDYGTGYATARMINAPKPNDKKP